MMKTLATVLAASAAIGLLAAAPSATAASTSGSSGGVGGGGSGGTVTRARLEARMESGNDRSQARARYEERQRGNLVMQRFDVEAEDFEPGTVLEVSVSGRFVGTLTIGALGTGEMQLRTGAFIDDPGDGSPIDSDFPSLRDGDTVTVGPLSGSFRAR